MRLQNDAIEWKMTFPIVDRSDHNLKALYIFLSEQNNDILFHTFLLV